eukprot:COSAG06_NODE_238_length_19422_cov_16.417741_7_plen_86_part_00
MVERGWSRCCAAAFICAAATAAGLLAEPFHAGLPADQREATQRRWTCGKTMVVCSTIAFGMGIDKSDVRLVAHWGCKSAVCSRAY